MLINARFSTIQVKAKLEGVEGLLLASRLQNLPVLCDDKALSYCSTLEFLSMGKCNNRRMLPCVLKRV